MVDRDVNRRTILKYGSGLATMTLAGCLGSSNGDGSNSGNSSKKGSNQTNDGENGGYQGKLSSVSFHIHSKIMEEMAKRYEQKTGTKVELINFPADKYDQKLTQALKTGSPHLSVMTMRPGPVGGLAHNGALSNIDGLMQKHKNEFYTTVKDRCRIENGSPLSRNLNGKYMALGNDVGSYVLMYNRDLFKKAGLPTEPDAVKKEIQTWKQFRDAGEQVMKKTGAQNMIADSLSTQNDIWVSMMNQMHGKYYTPLSEGGKAKFNFDQKANHKAAKVVNKLLEKNIIVDVPRLGAKHASLLKDEKVATVIGAWWMIFSFRGTDSVAEVAGSFPDMKGKWRVIPIPLPDGFVDANSHLPSGLKTKRAATQAGSLGGMPAGLPVAEKKAAKDWLDFWCTSKDKFDVELKVGVGPPFIPEGGEKKLKKGVPYFGGQAVNEIFAQSAKDSPHLFRTPTATVRNLMYQAGSKMFTQNQSVDKTLKSANEQMIRSIKGSGQS